MNKLIWILLCCLNIPCCAQHNSSTHSDTSPIITTEINSIADKLAQDAYGDFFNYTLQEDIINTVWAEAGGVAPLKAIVIDEQAPLKARLIAHEILLQKEFTYVQDEDVSLRQIATIYTKALVENTTTMANSWGLLYEYDDAGPIGTSLIMLGEDAIPALIKLLNNTTQLLYHGSKEATIGNAYQFRIKDVAAYYICRIKNIKPVYYSTHNERDAEIEHLEILLQLKK